jgi:hypothetical protein
MRGPSSYLFAGTLGIVGCLCLASILPRKISLPWLFYLLLSFGWGATTWMTFEFHYPLQVVNAYAIAIAVLTAWALGKEKKAVAPTAARPVIRWKHFLHFDCNTRRNFCM